MVEKSEDEEAIGKLSVDEKDEVITKVLIFHSAAYNNNNTDSISCGVERNASTRQTHR